MIPLSLSLSTLSLQHQLQAQHLSHHAQGLPLTSHPSGLQHPGLAALGGGSSLLALSGALGVQAQLAAKEERSHLEAVAAAAEHHRGTASERQCVRERGCVTQLSTAASPALKPFSAPFIPFTQ